MPATAKEFYEQTVRRLPRKERLWLAVMILNDLNPPKEQIDFSDSWSEEDLQDLMTFALSHGGNPHVQTEKKNSRDR